MICIKTPWGTVCSLAPIKDSVTATPIGGEMVVLPKRRGARPNLDSITEIRAFLDALEKSEIPAEALNQIGNWTAITRGEPTKAILDRLESAAAGAGTAAR